MPFQCKICIVDRTMNSAGLNGQCTKNFAKCFGVKLLLKYFRYHNYDVIMLHQNNGKIMAK